MKNKFGIAALSFAFLVIVMMAIILIKQKQEIAEQKEIIENLRVDNISSEYAKVKNEELIEKLKVESAFHELEKLDKENQ